MKTQFKSMVLAALSMLICTVSLQAQQPEAIPDSTGLPGDNFSLEGAIELFKTSASLDDFEKKLNASDNDVNNLDLNEDGEVDYIRVEDHMDGDAHAIVLQVPVNEKESQDIAVIEIEKNGAENALLQIVGDEDIFGAQTIAEPFEEAAQNGGKGGPSMVRAPVYVVVNVWLWPSVRFIYAPAYRVYVSPYYWRHYPSYWRPWRPYPYHSFYVRTRPHYHHCHVVTTHRVVHAHTVYAPRRSQSTVVHTRTTTTVTRNKAAGRPTVSHSTTTTSHDGRNGRSVEREKTTTTVEGRNGRSVEREKTQTQGQGRNGGTVEREKTQTQGQGRNGGTVERQRTETKAEGPRGGSVERQKTQTKTEGPRGGSSQRQKTTGTKQGPRKH